MNARPCPSPIFHSIFIILFPPPCMDRSNEVFIRYQISSYIIRFIIIYVPRITARTHTRNGERKNTAPTPCCRLGHRDTFRHNCRRYVCIFPNNDPGIHAVYELERVQLHAHTQLVHPLCHADHNYLRLNHQTVNMDLFRVQYYDIISNRNSAQIVYTIVKFVYFPTGTFFTH